MEKINHKTHRMNHFFFGRSISSKQIYNDYDGNVHVRQRKREGEKEYSINFRNKYRKVSQPDWKCLEVTDIAEE